MSDYYNEAGEPLMSGEAMRYEMYLDSMDEFDVDDYYDREDEEDEPEHDDEDSEPWEDEDGWLDGSYEE